MLAIDWSTFTEAEWLAFSESRWLPFIELPLPGTADPEGILRYNLSGADLTVATSTATAQSIRGILRLSP